MKRHTPLFLSLTLVGMLALVGCSATASYQRVHEPEGKVLSTHKTLATFDGLELSPCRHLTAECPDQCEHGGIYALFTINTYLAYEKLDTYGDEQQESFAIRVSNLKDVPDPALTPPLRKLLLNLEKGDTVSLDWTHVYVTYPNGLHTPERIVTRLAQ